MMGAIVLLHRWLGIAFCLLFAMWFATGIVMHFVPFPSLTEAERFAGLAPVRARRGEDYGRGCGRGERDHGCHARSPDPAQRRAGLYRVGTVAVRAVHASDGRDASVNVSPTSRSPSRGIMRAAAGSMPRMRRSSRARTMTNGACRTALIATGRCFVSLLAMLRERRSMSPRCTGEVVLDTTRSERGWNLAGSVLHWVYPTILRSNWALWDQRGLDAVAGGA